MHPPDEADLAQPALLDRDAVNTALAVGASVVTPNVRLARALKREHDLRQLEAGRSAWPSADALPWAAWQARLHADLGDDRAALLAPMQAQILWERVIRDAGAGALMDVPALAATAAEAWDTLHAYAGPEALAAAANEDQVAFRRWAHEFAAHLRARRMLSAAELASRLARDVAAGLGRLPAALLLAGFDALTPRQQALAAALRERGVQVGQARRAAVGVVPGPVRVVFADARAQWRAIAAWARARLRARPQARIGIVVPDLQAHRAALRHALAEALDPLQLLLADGGRLPPFNLSLGTALGETPLANAALAAFDLFIDGLDADRVGTLLRSPYLGVGDEALRAQLDVRLRADGRYWMDGAALRRAAQRHAALASELVRALAQIEALLAAAPRRMLPSRWAQFMFDALRALRFPGGRSLDSAEYQTWQRLREVLASLATLDPIAGELTLTQAVARVRRALADTLFQPEMPEVPVQVLGVLEAEHLRFDHLWVANLDAQRWPPPARPNPLLPLALQRAWAVPGASPALALARAQRCQHGWLHAAGEVVFSHAAADGDVACAPSPLIAAVALSPPPVAAGAGLAVALRGATVAEVLDDARGPALAPGAVRGGARLFTDQSACPFRAFAVHRLGARALEEPAPGLDPRARGSLLHAALAAFWRPPASQAALLALDGPAVEARVAAAVEQALAQQEAQSAALAPRARALEAERLRRTLRAWLEIERARPPFEVIAVECERDAVIGGMTLRLKPDRIDRVGEHRVLLDYKTSREVSARAWDTPRPEEPQLPLYVVSAPEPVDALAFARLRPGDFGFAALAAREGLVPGARVAGRDGAPDWDARCAAWRLEMAALARDYLAGEARVDPRDPDHTCEHCPLPLLCRIGERAAAPDDE